MNASPLLRQLLFFYPYKNIQTFFSFSNVEYGNAFSKENPITHFYN